MPSGQRGETDLIVDDEVQCAAGGEVPPIELREQFSVSGHDATGPANAASPCTSNGTTRSRSASAPVYPVWPAPCPRQQGSPLRGGLELAANETNPLPLPSGRPMEAAGAEMVFHIARALRRRGDRYSLQTPEKDLAEAACR